MTTRWAVTPALALLLITACAGSGSRDTAPTTDAPGGAVAVAPPWVEVAVESPDCACSDGSALHLYERSGDATRVLFYFEGGGACFDAGTCDPNGEPTFSPTIRETVDSLAERRGLFDPTNPANPLAGYSVVYVPYCTGDMHLGDRVTEYSPAVTIAHRGAPNARAAVAHLAAAYPDARQVFVMGASAGSVPAPLVAGLTADALPDATIIAFGDSSAAYLDVPAANEQIDELWGTTAGIPEWPENAGLTAADWSIPGLTVQAGLHAPDVTFARFDYANDGVQASFSALGGFGREPVVAQIDATEVQVEAAGVPIASFVAPGDQHTIVGADRVFETEVGGVRLIDWITELVDGTVPDDVHCTECDG